jgi:hypothetical protein
MPKRVQAIIEELQPYNAAGDPKLYHLAVLNTLSNVDKHHTVNLTSLRFLSLLPITDMGESVFEELDNGDVIITLAPGAQPEIDFEPYLALNVSMQFPGLTYGLCIYSLHDLYDFIRNHVIPRFSRSLPSVKNVLEILVHEIPPLQDECLLQ